MFENELGLYISERFFVMPLVYRDRKEFLDLERQYKTACGKVGLGCAIEEEWHLNSEIGHRCTDENPFASRKIIASEEHVLFRYNESEGQDHKAGGVIVDLNS